MSALKGFSSTFKAFMAKLNGVEYQPESLYATYTRLQHDKASLDTMNRAAGVVATSQQLDVFPWVGELGANAALRGRIIQKTGHTFRQGDILRFTGGSLSNVEATVEKIIDVNTVLLATDLKTDPGSLAPYVHLRPVTPTVDLSGNLNIVEGVTTVVDFLDAGALVPTGGNAIPRSSNNALEVVNSLAANVTRLQSVSDVGEFINLYLDAARTQLIAHMVLTPDEIVDVDIPAGSTIYMGAAKDADIDDPNSIIQINFIG